MTLRDLPPIAGRNGMPLHFMQRLQAHAVEPKKGGFPVVAAKKAAKMLEGLGKSVTGIHAHEDGSFTVLASSKSFNDAGLASDNEWDVLLSHD